MAREKIIRRLLCAYYRYLGKRQATALKRLAIATEKAVAASKAKRDFEEKIIKYGNGITTDRAAEEDRHAV